MTMLGLLSAVLLLCGSIQDPVPIKDRIVSLREKIRSDGALRNGIDKLNDEVKTLVESAKSDKSVELVGLIYLWADEIAKVAPETSHQWLDRCSAIVSRTFPAAAEDPDERRGQTVWKAKIADTRSVAFLVQGKRDDALKACKHAAENYRAIDAEAGTAEMEYRRGTIFLNTGRYRDAVAHLKIAAGIFEKLGDHDSLGGAAINRAAAHERLGEYGESLSAYKVAIAASEEAGDERRVAMVTMNRANILRAQGQLANAMSEYDRAAKIYERFGDDRGLGFIALNRGHVHSMRNDLRKAQAAYEKARDLMKDRAPRTHGHALLSLGSVLSRTHRYREAREANAQARKTFASMSDPVSIAQCDQVLALIDMRTGRFRDALAALSRAGDVFSRVGARPELAKIRLDQSTVLASLYRLDDALDAVDSFIATVRELGATGELANAHLNRGVILNYMERFDDALAEYDAAFEFVAPGDELSKASIHLNRSVALMELGRVEESLANLDRYEELIGAGASVSQRAMLQMQRGNLLSKKGENESAIEQFAGSARLFDEIGDLYHQVFAKTNQGNCLFKLGQPRQALQEYAEGARKLESVISRHVQAISAESSERWRATVRSIVPMALASAYRVEDADALPRAYGVLQTVHGLGMAAATAERGLKPIAGLEPEYAAQLADAEARLLAALEARDGFRVRRGSTEQLRASLQRRKELTDAVENAGRTVEELVQRARLLNRSYVDLAYPRPATLKEVQAELVDGAALVEFVVGDTNSWAIAISSGDAQLIPLGRSASIRTAVRKFVRDSAQGIAPTATALRDLGKVLVDPVLSSRAAQGATTLLIAPHDVMCQIPFEVLLTGDAAGARAEWPYLIESRDIAYVHSGTALVALRSTQRARKPFERELELVAFGHPFDARAEGAQDEVAKGDSRFDVDRGGDRKAIPATATEVLGVARLFASESELGDVDKAIAAFETDPMNRATKRVAGQKFAVYLRDEATEQRLRDEPAVRSARIVHLACHAEANLDAPALSRLVLACADSVKQAGGGDGYVYARDLRDVELRCELLVLSSCESNQGKLSPVEGMTGLARAGLAAGAQSVVSTLWRVGDESSRDLMLLFHESLAGSESRIRALSNAKREAIARGLPIRTWSAYVLWDAAVR